ncbi:MAG: transposase [Thermoplasmata archaeon HGW-Thermoplasmata-1]|nr:MAG: transposase [Thermoplasmata archaeon HGW-Thermoplasmata-1]
MQQTFKFRLYPNKEQESKLEKTLELCRFTYNKMLEWLNRQEKPNRLELQARLPKLKEEHPELKKVHSKVLQMETYRLFSNLKALSELKKKGRKAGRLRFKGKGWFKTFTYNQSGFKLVETGKRLDNLHLSKIGDIPIRTHRAVDGEIRQITVKRYPSGKWFACICVEGNDEKPLTKPHSNLVGIDVGVENFTTDSDGTVIENPKHIDRSLDKIAQSQKALSRKKKGSANRAKAKQKLAIAHERLTNQRNDFLHKVSKYYINNYKTIGFEDLNITRMIRKNDKNRYESTLRRHILDTSWNSFFQMLSYKAERAGGKVIKVNPKGTSQLCARCGENVPKRLNVRIHRCLNCGFTTSRDYNAALNIRNRAFNAPKEKASKPGQGLPVAPVEERPLSRHISFIEIVTGQVFLSKQEASSNL